MSSFRQEDNTRAVKRAIRTGVAIGLGDIVDSTSEAVDEGFDTGHDALGRPWEPLQPETIRKKGHSQILVEDGTMRESQYDRVNLVEHSAQIGFADPKIRYHEFGAPEVSLPARPVLGPAATYAETISDWKMKQGFEKSFDSMVD